MEALQVKALVKRLDGQDTRTGEEMTWPAGHLGRDKKACLAAGTFCVMSFRPFTPFIGIVLLLLLTGLTRSYTRVPFQWDKTVASRLAQAQGLYYLKLEASTVQKALKILREGVKLTNSRKPGSSRFAWFRRLASYRKQEKDKLRLPFPSCFPKEGLSCFHALHNATRFKYPIFWADLTDQAIPATPGPGYGCNEFPPSPGKGNRG